MFERFTTEARTVVEAAQVEARGLSHRRIGTEHLLLGLLGDPGCAASVILGETGLTPQSTRIRIIELVDCRAVDADALERIGIDLSKVRSAVEASFGEGALERAGGKGFSRRRPLPFSPKAKKVLELSLREALRLGDGHIGSEHVLLGVLREGTGLAALLLAEAGVTHQAVSARISADRRQAG